MKRKVFDFDDFSSFKIVPSNKLGYYTNTISACGLLLKHDDEILLIKYKDPNWPNLDDFGGQVGEGDETPFDTIIRETVEESNGVITKKMIKKYLKHGEQFYTQKSKYFCVVCEISDDDKELLLDSTLFGDIEIEDGIKRTINWYNSNDAKKNLCGRLKFNKEIMDYLYK